MGRKLLLLVLVICSLLAGCTLPETEMASTQTPRQPDQPTNTPTPDPVSQMDDIYFALDVSEDGLYLDRGGDVDSEIISVGDPAREGLRTGNGSPLPAPDGNSTGDYYLQFRVDDQFLFQGKPAARVQIEVEYLDQGTDHFSIEYDGLAGMFSSTGGVAKTDSGEIRTATFPLCDAYFANRDNGADFRITDWGDGPEIIFSVRVSRQADSQGPATIHVDSCGANPYDDQPDSEAIQSCLDLMCSGDTALFTSPGDNPAYQGYLINKSIVLVRSAAKHDLTFDSTDPDSHAFLKATPELLGFVVQLFGRSGINNPGQIDNITLTNLDLDGNRAERKCFGSDGIENGIDDNWGSWLNECTEFGDPWCSAGTLEMVGAFDASDPWQNFESNPDRWTTGLVIRDVKIANTECATAFGFNAAASIIDSVTIDTAGDHVHGNNCLLTDPDEAPTGWADGITMLGPENLVTNNTIINPSDIGIVTFGGRDTVISNNTIIAEPGNYGMFAGIAVHPYWFGINGGLQVIDNQIINEADQACGGIHAGIDIGPHMWGAGCAYPPGDSTIGNPNECTSLTDPPGVQFCEPGTLCRVWGYIPENTLFTLSDNVVTGAQINYLFEGFHIDGDLVVENNVSNNPRPSDWQGDGDCTWDGITDSWGALDFVAHDPTIDGWLDRRIYCER